MIKTQALRQVELPTSAQRGRMTVHYLRAQHGTFGTAFPCDGDDKPRVGDYFVRSWGYDQTNVDFWRVVGLTPSGKSVRVQKWSQTCESEQGGPSERVVPGEGPTQDCHRTEDGERIYSDSPIEVKRLNLAYGVRICVTHYGDHARLWDGSSMHQTGLGWGH